MNGDSYYVDPTSAEWHAPSLVTGLMQNPATEKQTPLERQLTVVVAWLAHHSEQLTRALLRRFFEGDASALAAISQDGLHIGARTWGTLRPVDGVTGHLYPDITITGSDRVIELIVEMKVDAGVHASGELDGRTLYQPDAYAHSWATNYDASKEARVRRVGTLTRDGVGVELWPDLAAWRAAEVRWIDVRDDLRELLDGGGIEEAVRTVAQEALEAIDDFVLATAVPGIEAKLASLPSELTWGYRVLTLLGPSLAEALPGGTIKQSFTFGKTHAYVGCNIYFATSGGERCVWLQVSPAGAGWAVGGRPVCLWAVEQTDSGKWPTAIRERASTHGFQDESYIVGGTDFRCGYPMDELQAHGDEAAQAGWLLGELVAALGP
ncbi:MAG: hypothetical protein ACRDOF_05945 [Gaiellaceae bacterium]